MVSRTDRNATKKKIVSAAWKLFYERGYDYTTVDDIIAESHTSKGSFYHYFEGKDALLGSLSLLFDEKYEELMKTLDPDMDSFEKLLRLNYELFAMIEDSVPLELLAQLFLPPNQMGRELNLELVHGALEIHRREIRHADTTEYQLP